MKTDEKVAKDFFRADAEAHIRIRADLCRACPFAACVQACPAGLYHRDPETKEARVEFAGCLECGTCRFVCVRGAIEWKPPKGGCGVQFRLG
jgi:ferredoxin like protein